MGLSGRPGDIGYRRCIQQPRQCAGYRGDSCATRDRIRKWIPIKRDGKHVARLRSAVGQRLVRNPVNEQVYLLQWMVRIRGREGDAELRPAAQDRVGGGAGPGARRSLGKGRGQRFGHHEPFVRGIEALIIGLGDVKAAGLVEVVLRVGELLSAGPRLRDCAITAGGPRANEGQQRGLAVRPEDDAPERSQAVRHGAGDEAIGRNAERGGAGFITHQVRLAEGRVRVGAHQQAFAEQPRVEYCVVEQVVTNVAGRVAGLGQDHRLAGESAITRHTLIHQRLGLSQRVGGQHRGQKGVAQGAGRRRLVKNLFAAAIAVRDVHPVWAAVILEAVEERGGGAVHLVAGVHSLEGDVHREHDVVHLAGQLARCEHLQERDEQGGLEVVAAPRDVATGPVDAQEVPGRDLAPLAVVVAQFAGVWAVLVDDHHRIQAATPGVKAAG